MSARAHDTTLRDQLCQELEQKRKQLMAIRQSRKDFEQLEKGLETSASRLHLQIVRLDSGYEPSSARVLEEEFN